MMTLNYLWQVPQHLLGIIIMAFTNVSSTRIYKNSKVYLTNSNFGVSLGQYIIVPKWADQNTIQHEYGHSVQSLYFGPLYLFVIGIPSLTMNVLTRIKVLRADRYYRRWPENWADKLGGVKRA